MTTPPDSTRSVSLDRYGYNTIARNTSMVLFTGLPLFFAAGTWAWDWAWVYCAVTLIGWTVLNVIVAAQNPALFNQRGKRTKDLTEGTKRWDIFLLSLYTVLLVLTPIVAGLDYRFGWSAAVSPAVYVLGIVIFALGFVPLTWAMAANRFFEPTVRIQDGHRVAADGPYRFVRHPGYLGIILHFVATPFALGTWVALIPALLGAAVYVVRTALEDQTLRQELPGYAEFAARTRYRLLPGVW